MRRSFTVLAAVSVSVLAPFGCGSSDDSTKNLGSSVDASSSGSAAAAADAASDVQSTPTDAGAVTDGDASDGDAADDSPEDIYPAPHQALPPMLVKGGPLLLHPKVVTITFEGDAARDETRAFNDGILASDWWAAVAKPYGIELGASAGHVETPDPFGSKTIGLPEVQSYLQSLIASGAAPAPDGNTAYAIYFSAATTVKDGYLQACTDFAGIHDQVTITLDAGAQQAPVVLIPVCSGHDRLLVTSHELIEVATDPLPVTQPALLLKSNAFGGSFYESFFEVADLCYTIAPAALWQGHRVTRSWVQSSAVADGDPCWPTPPNHVYFGAAPDTEIDPRPGPNNGSDGFIVVDAGSAKDVPIRVFSAAPLAHDLSILVGLPKHYPIADNFDPKDVAPLSVVTASLSQSTGHNGTVIMLHIAAPAGQPSLQYGVVRSILENDDYATWPFLLYVR